MPTRKKRINLSVDDALYAELDALRKLRNASSLSSVIIDLAKTGLEIEEDLYFARIADERSNEPELTHEEFWD